MAIDKIEYGILYFCLIQKKSKILVNTKYFAIYAKYYINWIKQNLLLKKFTTGFYNFPLSIFC